MNKKRNTKFFGDVSVGKAIAYYLENDYEVCLPIGDKRRYDFLIERDGIVKKVQVKYAGWYKNKQKCLVGLRITGGNQSYNYAKKYTNDAFDLLFVFTAKGECYEVPWKKIKARSEITIEHPKYRKYRELLTLNYEMSLRATEGSEAIPLFCQIPRDCFVVSLLAMTNNRIS